MMTSARLTFKQHRFELLSAVSVSVLLGVSAILINFRLASVDVPAGCFDAWLAGSANPACSLAIERFSQINGDEAGKVFAAMAVVPFIVGLLGGVPLVGRELESRTAHTAWSLAASRRRWLAWQVWPVVLVLGLCVTFAAFSASALHSTRAPLDAGSARDIGLYGIPVIVRAFASLGVGLICGATIGRTLPAFIVGTCLAIAMVLGLGLARDGWIASQPLVVFDQATVDDPGFNGVLVEQAWQASDGTVVKEPDAILRVPPEGSADPYVWLSSNGYTVVQLGLARDAAAAWQTIENLALVVIGGALMATSALVVERRRLG